VAIGNTLGWLVTTAGVCFVEQAGDKVRVRRAPLAGGVAADVATLPQFTRPGFEGAHVLFARWDRRDSNACQTGHGRLKIGHGRSEDRPLQG
jgi:hypothetical protein